MSHSCPPQSTQQLPTPVTVGSPYREFERGSVCRPVDGQGSLLCVLVSHNSCLEYCYCCHDVVLVSAVLSNCSSLSSPDNGLVEFNDTRIGSVAVYSCAFGYQLSTTSNERECLSNRTWSGDEPICISEYR